MPLVAVEKIINLFAATGHVHYAKSSRLFLLIILELLYDHPWLYMCFTEQGFILFVEAVNTGLGYGLTLLLSK